MSNFVDELAGVFNHIDAQFDPVENNDLQDASQEFDDQELRDFVYEVNLVFIPVVICGAIYYWLHW